jgi:hypothetical protein
MAYAGRTIRVQAGDTTWRVNDDRQLIVEVPRTTTRKIGRFKVRKPEPPRRTIPRGT